MPEQAESVNQMPLFRIYASADADEPICSTLTDDPAHGPIDALDLTRQTVLGPELTETAYAELVRE